MRLEGVQGLFLGDLLALAFHLITKHKDQQAPAKPGEHIP